MIQTIKNALWSVKRAWQRLTRGYDDRLFWSLRDYVDPMIVAHVTFMRDTGHGYPIGVTKKKWEKVLNTILAGFVPEPESAKDFKKYARARGRALVLLAFYWDELWD